MSIYKKLKRVFKMRIFKAKPKEPPFQAVSINRWPESQGCMGCKHGYFINPDTPTTAGLGSSCFVCTKELEPSSCGLSPHSQ
jgi:hypothetical protein